MLELKKRINTFTIHQREKKENLWFCAVSGYIITGCPTNMNIGQLIKGDDLIVLLNYKCSFRPIKMMRLVIFIVQ